MKGCALDLLVGGALLLVLFPVCVSWIMTLGWFKLEGEPSNSKDTFGKL